MSQSHVSPRIKKATQDTFKWRRLSLFTSVAMVPLIWTVIVSVNIVYHGTPGFRIIPTNDSFLVKGIDSRANSLKIGDRIISVGNISYYHFLGDFFHKSAPSQVEKQTVILRDDIRTSVPIHFEKIGWKGLIKKIWPNYILIAILATCALLAVLLSPPWQPTVPFFTTMISCALIIASQLVFHCGQLQPTLVSISFLMIAVANWVMFSAWVHYCLNFPTERQLLVNRPFIVGAVYLLPPLVSLAATYITTGLSAEFWGWLQRYRRWHIPIFLIGAYGKHIYDYFKTSSKIVKNQLRIPLITIWAGLGPYLFLYLLPVLLWNAPLISFRLVIICGLTLPFAYLYAMIRYRLFEIDEAVSNSLAYFILIIMIYVFYHTLLIVLNKLVGFQAQYILFPLIVSVVFFLNPMRRRVEFIINRLLFPHRTDISRLLQPFSHRLTQVTRMETLTKLLTDDFQNTFKIDRVTLEVFQKGKWRFFSSESALTPLPRPLSALHYYLENRQADIQVYNPSSDDKLATIQAEMIGLGYMLALGLKSGDKLVGVLFLGIKLNNRNYTNREIRIFKTLSNQATLALENCLNYEALKESRNRIQSMYKKMMRSEKLANIGETASILAHEIKNPLAVIRSSAQYLVSKPRDFETRRELLEYIVDEVDTLNLVFSNMLGLSGYNRPVVERFDLIDTLDNLLNRWENSHDHQPNIPIARRYSQEPLWMEGDRRQLSQMFVNLIRNGEAAVSKKGTISIDAAQNDQKDTIRISVSDTGMGIAEKNAGNLFQKFFTTKENGLGLGLSICRQIVKSHSGTLTLKNNSDHGATATVHLPKRQPPAALEKIRARGITETRTGSDDDR